MPLPKPRRRIALLAQHRAPRRKERRQRAPARDQTARLVAVETREEGAACRSAVVRGRVMARERHAAVAQAGKVRHQPCGHRPGLEPLWRTHLIHHHDQDVGRSACARRQRRRERGTRPRNQLPERGGGGRDRPAAGDGSLQQRAPAEPCPPAVIVHALTLTQRPLRRRAARQPLQQRARVQPVALRPRQMDSYAQTLRLIRPRSRVRRRQAG